VGKEFSDSKKVREEENNNPKQQHQNLYMNKMIKKSRTKLFDM
jgi:hypothetical protein